MKIVQNKANIYSFGKSHKYLWWPKANLKRAPRTQRSLLSSSINYEPAVP